MAKNAKYTDYEVVIRPARGAGLDVRELLRYRDLIGLFVKRNFILVYKQTILGPLWLILSPLLTSVVYTLLFGGMAQMDTDGVPAMVFYLASTTIWGLFNSGVTGTSDTFRANAAVFGKVYFPRLTVPIAQAITSILNFAIQLVLTAIIYVVYIFMGTPLGTGWAVILIPLLVVQAAVLAMAVGAIVTSLTTKYRDLAIAVSFGMQLWMYLTPVVYSLTSVGGLAYTLLLCNPMTAIVQNFRYCLLGTGQLLTWPWLISIAMTLALAWIGVHLYSKTEKTFVDTI